MIMSFDGNFGSSSNKAGRKVITDSDRGNKDICNVLRCSYINMIDGCFGMRSDSCWFINDFM